MFWQAAQITIDKLRGIVAWRTMAEGKQEGAIDVAGLASKYNNLLASLTSIVEDAGSRQAAVKLGKARDEFLSACNGLVDEMVELKQHLVLQPAPRLQQQQQPLQHQRPSSGQADRMQVDGEQQPQDVAASLMQLHGVFINSMQPNTAPGGQTAR